MATVAAILNDLWRRRAILSSSVDIISLTRNRTDRRKHSFRNWWAPISRWRPWRPYWVIGGAIKHFLPSLSGLQSIYKKPHRYGRAFVSKPTKTSFEMAFMAAILYDRLRHAPPKDTNISSVKADTPTKYQPCTSSRVWQDKWNQIQEGRHIWILVAPPIMGNYVFSFLTHTQDDDPNVR